MRVTVNGESTPIDDGATVADLLKSLEVNVTHVAVDRNCELAPRREHAQTTLRDGDRLEIVTLVGGG